MAGPKHSCGVVGMHCADDVSASLFKALRMIQHRGQESAGISVFNGESVVTEKNNGLVHEAITPEMIKNARGNCGIGHVRYSTVGSKGAINAQPIVAQITFGTISIAHNGDITNYQTLKSSHLENGMTFLTDSDSELILRLMTKHMMVHHDIVKAIRYTMGELEGAYSLVILFNNRLFAVRDPYGFRPLCISKLSDGYVVASESVAADIFRGQFVRDVEPGEIVEILVDDYKSYPMSTTHPCAHCMFEWIYFARPDSIIDGREVYEVRRSVGKILARESPADVDLVMPVPDSGRAHALGFSIESGIRYEEGFMKNRFVERTFILPDQKQREAGVAMKLNPIRSTVKGKRLLLVDDSIVRGTTLIKLVKMLREAGAEEVHVRIGCPPVIAPCYYGVDMKSREQFIANRMSIDQIRDHIGADSLGYITLEGLVEAIGIPEKDLCLACVNNKYPTNIPGENHRFQSTLNREF